MDEERKLEPVNWSGLSKNEPLDPIEFFKSAIIMSGEEKLDAMLLKCTTFEEKSKNAKRAD